MTPYRILVVRLGAMGDVIHALPAVVSLKQTFPAAHLSWMIDPKWAPLLRDNPYVDQTVVFDRRRLAGIRAAWRHLRKMRYDLAVDLQGLIKSAAIVAASGAGIRVGFDRSSARESLAAYAYSRPVAPSALHVVDRYLEVARAAGASSTRREFPLPPGRPEGDLPDGPFILACPLAGWESKQWPLEYYSVVARQLRAEGSTLVVSGAPSSSETLSRIDGAHAHVSGIEGLIDATRRACGVIGVDSGPLHLAAALGRPGVAIFGPTDPARNGPFGGTFTVLRDPSAQTTYKRGREIAASMRAVRPEAVLESLRIRLAFYRERTKR
jgi:heptosyltransferase-1